MKEQEYAKTSWWGYLLYLKAELGRNLTKKEIELAMQRYIHGVKVEVFLEEMKK